MADELRPRVRTNTEWDRTYTPEYEQDHYGIRDTPTSENNDTMEYDLSPGVGTRSLWHVAYPFE